MTLRVFVGIAVGWIMCGKRDHGTATKPSEHGSSTEIASEAIRLLQAEESVVLRAHRASRRPEFYRRVRPLYLMQLKSLGFENGEEFIPAGKP